MRDTVLRVNYCETCCKSFKRRFNGEHIRAEQRRQPLRAGVEPLRVA